VLSKVRLSRFRCFEALEFFPGLGRTYLVGSNAQGKTSILEAVCVLLRLQSPRTSQPSDMFLNGEGGFALSGMVGDTHLECRQSQSGRSLQLDSKPQSKPDDYLATARLTWFSNADLELVNGPGAARRRYLDFLGMQVLPGYRKVLRSYERALRARNALLKDCRPRSEVDAFTPVLVEAGGVLLAARAKLIDDLTTDIAQACIGISGGGDILQVTYRPGCDGDFTEALAASRGKEERLRQTVCGPHRDDLELVLNGLSAASFASEGQQRTIALSLKIAQARYLNSIHGVPPLLLLDDIFGELDATRRNLLLEALPTGAQSIITTTFLDWAQSSEGESVFRLESGKLTLKE
jgi:DNA replication and repair protein RecF